MRKALFILALVTITAAPLFAGGAGEAGGNAQKYKYEYLFETDLPTNEFKEVFYKRLSSKYNWSPLQETNLMEDTYNSLWSFTDENQQRWECEVTIKRTAQNVAVTLEMEPVIGS